MNGLRILGAAAHIDNGDGVDWADAEVGDTVTLRARWWPTRPAIPT